MSSVRYIRLDAAGNRGFSGARIVPGADVWLGSEASRSLEPDGWLVRRNSSRRQAMKTRMRRRSPRGGGVCRVEHNGKKVKSCVKGEVLPLDGSLLMGGWRIQCTSCQAVFTVLPHFALRYRRMSPEVARQALIATHGGLSLEWCATICHISPMALYRLLCALGQHSLVTVLVKCHVSLPTSILADEKHGRCLTDRVYLPTIVSGRVIWHLGYSDAKSAAAFTASYGLPTGGP